MSHWLAPLGFSVLVIGFVQNHQQSAVTPFPKQELLHAVVKEEVEDDDNNDINVNEESDKEDTVLCGDVTKPSSCSMSSVIDSGDVDGDGDGDVDDGGDVGAGSIVSGVDGGDDEKPKVFISPSSSPSRRRGGFSKHDNDDTESHKPIIDIPEFTTIANASSSPSSSSLKDIFPSSSPSKDMVPKKRLSLSLMQASLIEEKGASLPSSPASFSSPTRRGSDTGSNLSPELLGVKASVVSAGAGAGTGSSCSGPANALNLTENDFLALSKQGAKGILNNGYLTYAYQELVRRNFRKEFGDLPGTALEEHLSDSDFDLFFKMTREEFRSMPLWKRNNKKKTLFLF